MPACASSRSRSTRRRPRTICEALRVGSMRATTAPYFLGAGTLLARTQLDAALEPEPSSASRPCSSSIWSAASLAAGVPFTPTGMTPTEMNTAVECRRDVCQTVPGVRRWSAIRPRAPWAAAGHSDHPQRRRRREQREGVPRRRRRRRRPVGRFGSRHVRRAAGADHLARQGDSESRFERPSSILVTGSTGIAAAAARALHDEGARVFVMSRTAEHVEDLLRSSAHPAPGVAPT